jgi:hypothetical protein
VDGERRRRLAREVLDGYVSGPDAPVEATAAALARSESARAVVLVEGISDQIAVETLADRQGRDLAAEEVVIVPIGGAHAMRRYLVRFGQEEVGLTIVGMCDAAEEHVVRRGLAAAGFGSPQNRIEMERLGFFVCEKDLEDELIRASGRIAIEALLDAQGDLGSFQTLQQQPAWRSSQASLRPPSRPLGSPRPNASAFDGCPGLGGTPSKVLDFNSIRKGAITLTN